MVGSIPSAPYTVSDERKTDITTRVSVSMVCFICGASLWLCERCNQLCFCLASGSVAAQLLAGDGLKGDGLADGD